MESQSEPTGTGGIIVISAGNTGFKVACGTEVHYVATLDQLVALLGGLIVCKGRGKSSRYEIRAGLSQTARTGAPEGGEDAG